MKRFNKQTLKAVGMMGTGLALILFSTGLLADGEGLTSIATTVTTEAGALAKLLYVISYVAGVGFALGGILQFKAHKDNPQQTPLSKPVVYLVVAACLLFLPSILDIAGSSIFGSTKSSAATASSPLGS